MRESVGAVPVEALTAGDRLRSPAGGLWRVADVADGRVTVTLVGGSGHEVGLSKAEVDAAAGWSGVGV